MNRKLRTADNLVERVEKYGFIPFFRNKIAGFSIQEMADPSLWFADDADGPWEWKGPAIRTGRVAYGKFFRAKAGYISLSWLPYFISYRREKYPLSAVSDEVTGNQTPSLAAIPSRAQRKTDTSRQIAVSPLGYKPYRSHAC